MSKSKKNKIRRNNKTNKCNKKNNNKRIKHNSKLDKIINFIISSIIKILIEKGTDLIKELFLKFL